MKKIGRTTGLTAGEILGPWVTPLSIPYKSSQFSSVVHFKGAWAVSGGGGAEFSAPGDSGSLVVTEDGQHAVGLIFGGAGPLALMIPIAKVLGQMNLSLARGHNA